MSCSACGKSAEYEISLPVCSVRCRKDLVPGKAYHEDIERATLENTDYRRVVYTTQQQQLVLMTITAEDGGIEAEIHPHTTQFIRIEAGEGEVLINGAARPLHAHDAIMVPAGTLHQFVVTGSEPLKLYSIYSPPHHPENLVQHRRGHED